MFFHRFNRVTEEEQGVYICTAENIAGKITAEASLQIIGTPSVSIQPSSPYVVQEGERVRMLCTATGDPVPNVVWKRQTRSRHALGYISCFILCFWISITPQAPNHNRLPCIGYETLEIYSQFWRADFESRSGNRHAGHRQGDQAGCRYLYLLRLQQRRPEPKIHRIASFVPSVSVANSVKRSDSLFIPVYVSVRDTSVVPGVDVESRVVAVNAGSRAELKCSVIG